jgi:hypothetical protein
MASSRVHYLTIFIYALVVLVNGFIAVSGFGDGETTRA